MPTVMLKQSIYKCNTYIHNPDKNKFSHWLFIVEHLHIQNIKKNHKSSILKGGHINISRDKKIAKSGGFYCLNSEIIRVKNN